MDPTILSQPEQQSTRLQRISILILGGAIVVFILYWLAGFSFIEVTVSGQSSGNIQYSLLNQGGGSPTTTDTGTATIKKLVRRGSFEVTVNQSGASFFSVVTAKGVFRTTSVNATLQKEKGREFIGDNPAPCMYLFKRALISYGCGGPFKDALIHVPAAGLQATYNQSAPSEHEGAVEGFVRVGEQDIVVIKNASTVEAADPAHTAYAVGDNLTLSPTSTDLSTLRSADTYTVVPYKMGFLAYDLQPMHFVYYKSVEDRPEIIVLDQPKEEGLEPYLATTHGDTIAVAYSASSDKNVDPDNPETTADNPSVIVVRSGDTSRQFSFGKQYSEVRICGQDKLCLTHNRLLEVYDISKTKPAKFFEIGRVNGTEYVGNTLLVVQDGRVLGIDIASRSGSIQYSFGQYQYCGIGLSGTNYLLCVINSKQKKSALLISQDQTSDGIDQKVAKLLELNEVTSVSVYKKSIYISPDGGKLTYQPSIGGYGYDPSRVAAVNLRINQKLTTLGINRAQYQIINTLD